MFELMSAQNGMNHNNNSNNIKKKTTRPTAVLPMMATLISAAILLSGLSLVSNGSYQSAIAQQQNITTGSGGSISAIGTNNATTASGGTAQGGNATTSSGGIAGSNQSTSDLRTSIEQARTALQSNDTQSAIMYLDMALSAASGGVETGSGTTTSSNAAGGSGGNETSTGGDEGVSVGGTSAADDYDETADADG
jgi:predicted membrane-bound mannosyltransferase